MTRSCLLVLVLAAVTLLGGCWRSPWEAYPMDTMPDVQCSVGGSVHGTDLYIWNCVDDMRVAIGKYSAEMWQSSPERSVARCGELTELELRLKPTPEQCTGPRSGMAWQVGD